MLIEVGAFILSYIAIEAVGYVFSFVKRKIRENGYENLGFVYKLDQEYQPTEVDVELIGQSKDLLNKYFQEDNRVGVLQSKSIEDRIELIKQLTEDIVALYDVDVQIARSVCIVADISTVRPMKWRLIWICWRKMILLP